jgi:hypothetical protein
MLVGDDESREAILVDPSALSAELDEILRE